MRLLAPKKRLQLACARVAVEVVMATAEKLYEAIQLVEYR